MRQSYEAVWDSLSYVECIRYQQSKELLEPPASHEGDKDGTRVRMEPEEGVGSIGLETHIFINLGIHLKLWVCSIQRCQFLVDCAFFLRNSLTLGSFLGLFYGTTGETKAALETILGGFPKIDLEAVAGLEEIPRVRFFLRCKKVLATHLVWVPDKTLFLQNTHVASPLKTFVEN